MPSSPTTTRDPWFDNAKMALVTLVVVGHAWTLLPHDSVDDQLYDFLYSWHVPAFVLVTGHLSRSFAWTGPRLWSLVRTVAVPYVLVETALALFRIHVGHERLADLFADPHWPMWYLSALFFWRLLTPLFQPLHGGAAVAVAVVVSLLAGMRAGDTLDLARILGLLPFFVLGLKATPDRLERLRGSRRLTALAALTLVGLLVLAHWTDAWASTEWLYYRSQYVALDHSDLHAMLVRSGVLAMGLLGAWAFLTLVPRTGSRFSAMGSASLVVYLVHGFVVKGLQYSPYPDWAAAHPGAALPLTTLGAIGLALLLASPPVAARLGVLVDPVGFAQRHVHHAHELTAATREAEEIAGHVAGQVAGQVAVQIDDALAGSAAHRGTELAR